MGAAHFTVIERGGGSVPTVIRDIGDHTCEKTVTNDAENVVQALFKIGVLHGQKLYYYDSEGELAELRYKDNGVFDGFGPAPLPAE